MWKRLLIIQSWTRLKSKSDFCRLVLGCHAFALLLRHGRLSLSLISLKTEPSLKRSQLGTILHLGGSVGLLGSSLPPFLPPSSQLYPRLPPHPWGVRRTESCRLIARLSSFAHFSGNLSPSLNNKDQELWCSCKFA